MNQKIDPINVEKLIAEIADKIRQVREATFEIMSVNYGPGVSFEIRPINEGNSMAVYFEDLGCTTVDFSKAGLEVSMLAERRK